MSDLAALINDFVHGLAIPRLVPLPRFGNANVVGSSFIASPARVPNDSVRRSANFHPYLCKLASGVGKDSNERDRLVVDDFVHATAISYSIKIMAMATPSPICQDIQTHRKVGMS